MSPNTQRAGVGMRLGAVGVLSHTQGAEQDGVCGQPGSPLGENCPAQSQGHSYHSHSDRGATPGGCRLSQDTLQKRLLRAGQLRGSGGSGGHLGGHRKGEMAGGGWGGRWVGRQEGGGTSSGGRTQLPHRGTSPQGHLGLSASPSRRAPPALPAGHPLPWTCLPGGCLHGGHPFVQWFSNVFTSQNHRRLAPLLPSEVLSPWVWRGPDTQHFPGSCFSGDPLGDALPWTTASRSRSFVLPGEGG